jgi:hypothetical protein
VPVKPLPVFTGTHQQRQAEACSADTLKLKTDKP